MVVFTSGLVDDHRTRLRLGGQACGSGWLLVASRWWGTGSGTLLGPEESAVVPRVWGMASWVFWFLLRLTARRGLFASVRAGLVWEGVGGVVV